jgi:hypothetical protein
VLALRKPGQDRCPSPAKGTLGHPVVLLTDLPLVQVERLPVRAQYRQVNVGDELCVYARQNISVASHQDQIAYGQSALTRDTGLSQTTSSPTGTLLLIVNRARVIHHVVKPKRRLDPVRMRRQVARLVKQGKACVDVRERVVGPMRLRVPFAQLGENWLNVAPGAKTVEKGYPPSQVSHVPAHCQPSLA